MPDLDLQTDEQARAALPPGPQEATIATSPETADDDLFVTIDNSEDRSRYGPVLGWAAHPTDTDPRFPVRGDDALVVAADTKTYWLIAWSPA